MKVGEKVDHSHNIDFDLFDLAKMGKSSFENPVEKYKENPI
jgi:hypothetical protein